MSNEMMVLLEAC